MPQKRAIKEEWYSSFTCGECAKIKPITDQFTRVADNSAILGFCEVVGHCVMLKNKAKSCYAKRETKENH